MRRKGTARRQTRYDVDDDLSGTVSFFSFRISTPDQRFIRLTFRLNQLKQRQTVTYRNVSNEKLSLLPLGFPCSDCAEKRCVCVCVRLRVRSKEAKHMQALDLLSSAASLPAPIAENERTNERERARR